MPTLDNWDEVDAFNLDSPITNKEPISVDIYTPSDTDSQDDYVWDVEELGALPEDVDHVESENAGPSPMTFPTYNPMAIAAKMVESGFTKDGIQTIHRYKGDYYVWNGSHYLMLPEDAVDSVIWKWLSACKKITVRDQVRREVEFNPNANQVSNIKAALKAKVYVDDSLQEPCWLNSASGRHPALENCIAFANGILDIKTTKFMPTTPLLFNTTSIPIRYTLRDTGCPEWMKFLDSVWGDDEQSINTLQEVMGYLLTTDIRYQKIFMIIGPTRSGKGTIANIIEDMLGRDNVCSPTLKSLEGEFGMMQLLNKQAAIVSDARIGSQSDQKIIAERLLTISGGDTVSVNRKGRSFWEGKLKTRIILMSNEVPMLTDSSGALVNRMIVLKMTNSFLGREDLNLLPKLKAELPGILKWAIEGLVRLTKRGRFVTPDSAAQEIQMLSESASPTRKFVEDCCKVEAAGLVSEKDLYTVWCNWSSQEGMKQTTKNRFTRDLQAAYPALKRTRPREGEVRTRMWKGLRLTTNAG